MDLEGKVFLHQSPLDEQCTQTELAVAQPLWCSQTCDVEPRVVGQRLGCSHWKPSLGMLPDLRMKAEPGWHPLSAARAY